ncbi:hypothetical protein [Nocardia sp. NBC_01009]|uniref:hypothetical protein n=1 Tax=Nocardia sp. NBC_01009 TaxID=2975996 RepID=UPI00386F3F5F|nr:hypothetical protein OHA42_07735 [Nocardia sp. NBC_01009]
MTVLIVEADYMLSSRLGADAAKAFGQDSVAISIGDIAAGGDIHCATHNQPGRMIAGPAGRRDSGRHHPASRRRPYDPGQRRDQISSR